MHSPGRFKLFASWKDRLTCSESVQLVRELRDHLSRHDLSFELSVCPSMVALRSVAEELPSTVRLAAQNLIWDDTVSFTGETSAKALCEIGCKYVIIGHSERRLHLGETNQMVARKIASAIRHDLIPVVCVGESFEDYQLGRAEDIVAEQMDAVHMGLRGAKTLSEFIIAYEPAWAISTSRYALKCEPAEANSRHHIIRQIIKAEWGDSVARRTSVIYGGSVGAENAQEYLAQSDIDGGLVGSASQSRESFISLIEVTNDILKSKPQDYVE